MDPTTEVIMKRDEVTRLYRANDELAEIKKQMAYNENWLEGIERRHETTAIYKTADGLVCMVHQKQGAPVMYRDVRTDTFDGISMGEIRPTFIRRTYRRAANAVTENRVVAVYEEEVR